MSVGAAETIKGRVALVTGAGRGIGRSVAIGLAEMGASVALVSRSELELEEVAAAISASGGSALVAPADVSDRAQISAVLGRIVDELGPVDILVNNAAVLWPVAPSTTIDIAEFARTIEINVLAPVALTFDVLPSMLARRWGRIVNVSSGIVARPQMMGGANAYVTSKSALEGHTINLANELAETGVSVNVYRPGGVDTSMQGWVRAQGPQRVGAALHERFVKNFEGGTLISPEASAASLLRRIAGNATGQIWDVQDE